ncbi:glycoside hydrolase family 10 protein [Flammeovirga pectinis]|uniref:Glycoside hydrolase family 10 protein n=1 Tax=Flammeovirga pectinis TaxID=2494373 RepID=A0A3Q9FRS7_9BACT|nr:family 10 glycosylhydrolase [Flammeovirga pectinis]AZQ64490.1 glycoside hydrolase family 10 protein [Flammeovirga pectinis]
MQIRLLFLLFFSVVASIGYSQENREFRAVWIATVNNIDFPSSSSASMQAQREDYVRYLDKISSIGFNTVIVQVRPVADTFYPSAYEPWSKFLTGEQGKSPNPYFNPLSFMIEEAHKRNLDFHAWFNPYRVTMNADTTALTSDHPFYTNRDWFVKYGNKYYYNPGHPKGRDFVIDAIMDVARHYDIDAVHFDDYFYPYPIAGQDFPDQETFDLYADSTQFLTIEDWRRSNVDYFVKTFSERLHKERPDVQFGISPFGVWRNKEVDPKGSATRAGITNYDDLYADVVKWMANKWLDYVIPQVYWHRELGAAPYEEVVMWWNNNSFGTNLYIGQALYKLGEKWMDPNEISAQIDINRKYNNVKGNAFFSAKYLFSNPLNVVESIQEKYNTFVLPPSSFRMEQDTPNKVRITNAEGNIYSGVSLSWEDKNTNSDIRKYVIYRYETTDIGSLKGQFILDMVNKQPYQKQEFTDLTIKKGVTYTYIVTALDANKNESSRSNAIMLKAGGLFSKKVKIIH